MKPTNTACTFLLLTIIFACAGAALAQAPVPLPTDRADTMVIKTELVSFPVSVTDKEGRHFTGLDRSAFTIFEDGVTQEIAFFSTGDDPASIGIVFDLSGSMNGKKSEQAKVALTRLMQSGHQDDEYSLFAFNDRTRARLERVRDGAAIERAVKPITPQGNTALYDAIGDAIEQVKQGRWAKRAIIIISDGEDNRSRTTLRKLKQMVLEAGVTVYAVITEENRLPRFFGAEDLRGLAERSGGKAFVPETAEQLDEIFDQIALEMRQQYSLAYLPTNFQDDGRWRRLKVKIVPPPSAPPLIVKAREGYYAIGSRTQPRQSGFTNARN